MTVVVIDKKCNKSETHISMTHSTALAPFACQLFRVVVYFFLSCSHTHTNARTDSVMHTDLSKPRQNRIAWQNHRWCQVLYYKSHSQAKLISTASKRSGRITRKVVFSFVACTKVYASGTLLMLNMFLWFVCECFAVTGHSIHITFHGLEDKTRRYDRYGYAITFTSTYTAKHNST